SKIRQILYSTIYDGILGTLVPTNVKIVGFANYIVVVVTGKTLDEVTTYANDITHNISNWLRSAGFQLANLSSGLNQYSVLLLFSVPCLFVLYYFISYQGA
ncbi:hypothetical protein TSAR_016771, partial [Trichomalopsis sarcophagae]